MAELRPDLLTECGDGCFAACARNSDDRSWLAGMEARCGKREGAADVADENEGGVSAGFCRLAFGDDRGGPFGDGLVDKSGSIRLDTGNREKDPARLDPAAVIGQAFDPGVAQGAGARGLRQKLRQPAQWISPFVCCGVLAKP